MDLAQLREDYALQSLDESEADALPLTLFERWLEEAIASKVMEPNAMTLATTNAFGHPKARTVLIKGIDSEGRLQFFTNYGSDKAKEAENQTRVALLFFWPELQRQVRIEGDISRLTPEESEAYFHSRPRGSQIGAWASRQSNGVTNRAELEKKFAEMEARFEGQQVEYPIFWGGYAVSPLRWEFWQGRPSRLHDRLLYERSPKGWRITRLAP